jgi:TonB family protein
MRILLAAALLAGLGSFSAAALADCTRPKPGFEILDGTSVSEQEIKAVQAPLVEFANKVGDYLRCLNGESSQRSVGKDEAARTEIARQHVAAHQAAADELTGLVECYKAQLQSFKSSGGGQQKRAADCSSYMTAAANRSGGSRAVTSELVVEASGSTVAVPGGSWLYYLVRDDTPRRCSRQGAEECLYRAVHVRNDSDTVLECKGEITYEGTDANGNATTRSQVLAAERGTYLLVESLSKQGVNAQTFDATCTPRAKLPPLDTPANCKYEVVQPVAISDYYPQAAREAAEEGPVTVEFTLAGKAGHPTNVKAVASSMYPSLDAAAVKAVTDMVMSSTCPKARYRLKLSFQLEQ